MSLNLMSLIGMGRVGLRPNSDVTMSLILLFFLKASLTLFTLFLVR